MQRLQFLLIGIYFVALYSPIPLLSLHAELAADYPVARARWSSAIHSALCADRSQLQPADTAGQLSSTCGSQSYAVFLPLVASNQPSASNATVESQQSASSAIMPQLEVNSHAPTSTNEHPSDSATVSTYIYDPVGQFVAEIRRPRTQNSSSLTPAPISPYEQIHQQITEYLWGSRPQLPKPSALNSRAHSDYDNLGRLTTYTDQKGGISRLEYDDRGRLVTLISPLGGRTKYQYDDRGNITGITDPNGYLWLYEYDTANRLIRSVDANGSTTTYRYDEAGNLTSRVDPLGNSIQFAFDGHNRLTRVIDAEGAIISFTYDKLGNVNSITDAQGQTTNYEYDTNGRISMVTDASGQETYYRYDEHNNIIAITNTLGTTSYQYDGNGNLVEERDALGRITRYTISENNYHVIITTPNGGTIEQEYDFLGRVVKIRDASGKISLLAYDSNGNIVRETEYDDNYTNSSSHSSGKTTSYRYDALNRLVARYEESVHPSTYTYDGEGNRLVKDSQTWTYTYDKIGNLVARTDPSGMTTQYRYEHGVLTAVATPYNTQLVTLEKFIAWAAVTVDTSTPFITLTSSSRASDLLNASGRQLTASRLLTDIVEAAHAVALRYLPLLQALSTSSPILMVLLLMSALVALPVIVGWYLLPAQIVILLKPSTHIVSAQHAQSFLRYRPQHRGEAAAAAAHRNLRPPGG